MKKKKNNNNNASKYRNTVQISQMKKGKTKNKKITVYKKLTRNRYPVVSSIETWEFEH